MVVPPWPTGNEPEYSRADLYRVMLLIAQPHEVVPARPALEDVLMKLSSYVKTAEAWKHEATQGGAHGVAVGMSLETAKAWWRNLPTTSPPATVSVLQTPYHEEPLFNVPKKCRVIQYGDTMACGPCALQWDTNDPDPPACKKGA